MFKKVLVSVLVLAAALFLVSCKDNEDVLVIRAWNTEFQDRFRAFYPGFKETLADGRDLLEDGTLVDWVIVANDNNAYQQALDAALAGQSKASKNKKIDIFLIEADYATKYANEKFAMDVYGEIGITKEQLSNQYKYTQDIVTDSQGILRGTSWQATPGLYAYRTDIAEEVFGFSDPERVQAELATWEKFDAAAAKMKEANKKMLSGFDDSFRTFSNNFSNPWVDANNNVVVDQKLLDWIKQTKEYSTKEYTNENGLWSAGWQTDQGPTGDVFGFFYSTWGINFTLAGNSLADANKPAEVGNGLFGKYKVVKGPESYYWGGTWIVGAKGSNNPELVKDIMLKLTADAAIAEDITRKTEDYTNHKGAMNKIANDATYGSAFLGGQNHIKLFTESAAAIDMKNASPYDQGLNEGIQNAMKDYFIKDGVAFDVAWDNFKTTVTTTYPELKFGANPKEPK